MQNQVVSLEDINIHQLKVIHMEAKVVRQLFEDRFMATNDFDDVYTKQIDSKHMDNKHKYWSKWLLKSRLRLQQLNLLWL